MADESESELPFEDEEALGKLADEAEAAYDDDEVDFNAEGMKFMGPIPVPVELIAVVAEKPVNYPFKDGTRALRFRFMVTEEGEFFGLRRDRYVALEGDWKWKYAETCEGLGMDDVAKGERKARLSEFEGKTCIICIRPQKNDPEGRDEIWRVRALKTSHADSLLDSGV